LTDLYSRAQGLANNPPGIAERSPYTTEAINALVDQARSGGLLPQAENQLSRTLGGDYLDVASNPYLSGAVAQALNQVKRGVSGQFSGSNYGSSANQEWLARNLADTALPIYAQAYGQERQNQLNALNVVPMLQNARFQNLQGLLTGGALEESRNQAVLDAPTNALMRYGQLLGSVGVPSSGTTTTTGTVPYFTNPYANALGGAITGAQFGSQIGGLFGGSGSGFGGGIFGEGYYPSYSISSSPAYTGFAAPF